MQINQLAQYIGVQTKCIQINTVLNFQNCLENILVQNKFDNFLMQILLLTRKQSENKTGNRACIDLFQLYLALFIRSHKSLQKYVALGHLHAIGFRANQEATFSYP